MTEQTPSVAQSDQRPEAKSPSRWLGSISRACQVGAINLLCPPQCQHCGLDVEANSRDVMLCQPCRLLLAPHRGSTCPRCAGPVPDGREADPDCPRCETTQFHFSSVVGLGVYTGELRHAVLRIKEPLHEPLALTLGRLLADEVRARWPSTKFDLVLPIPMYWSRRWSRGHNGPEILAESLSRRLGVRLATDALVCVRNVQRQSTLAPSERFQNVRGAFRLSKAFDLRDARLLLVDDTLTTGATASEAARVLKLAGAADVRVAVAARGIGVD